MKKLYTQAKWKKHSLHRQRDEEKKRKRHVRYLRDKGRGSGRRSYTRGLQKRARRSYSTIPAPTVFSFVTNPEGMTAFFSEVRRAEKRKNVEIDLSGVKQVSMDAILVFLSEIAKFSSPIKGNVPDDKDLANAFAHSGFYDYVHTRKAPPKRGLGAIRRRQSQIVDGKIARELISFATEKLYGSRRKLGGVYRTLLECMSNTIDHASGPGMGREMWWGAVFCNADNGKAHFAFVDTGVGIFESARMHPIKRVMLALGIGDNRDILRDILEGRVESRTRVPFRGKGLPGIRKSFERRHLSGLVIVANDVYADLARDDFRILGNPFSGTFLYWEVERDEGRASGAN